MNDRGERRIDIYEILNQLALYNLYHREQHRRYQDKARKILNDLEEKLDNLEFKSKHYMNELEKIQNLWKYPHQLWYKPDGKIRYDAIQEEINEHKEAIPKDKLETFFDQFDPKAINKDLKREQIKVLARERQILKHNFAVYGKFPLYYLKQMKVLVDIKLKQDKIDKLFKKSSLIFYDDGDNGFKISLVYVEKIHKNTYEAILTTFRIDTKSLLSLRRRKSTKATVRFGEATFNIFELVNFLNKLCSKTALP